MEFDHTTVFTVVNLQHPKAEVGLAKLYFWILERLQNDHHFEVKLNIKNFVFHAYMACHRQKIRWFFW